MDELHQDSGSRSAAGVAAYPTRPLTPADPRSDGSGKAHDGFRFVDSWWLLRNGSETASPALSGDLDCDVAVIGAGISGALIAHGLAEDGHEVVVLDRRDRALGGTAASTALLQYEIDTMLGQHVRTVGPVRARLVYQACVDAIGLLDALDEPDRLLHFRARGDGHRDGLGRHAFALDHQRVASRREHRRPVGAAAAVGGTGVLAVGVEHVDHDLVDRRAVGTRDRARHHAAGTQGQPVEVGVMVR